jgi:mannose-6-phosphate isomerase-like protein (cupin superfamily)
MNKVTDKKNARHYLWGNNCESWALAETESLSVKLESMPPGTREQLHFHTNAQQFFFIVKGIATFYVDNKKEIVTEQQGLLINKNTKHFIANETNEPLDFLVISQPSTHKDRTNVQ